MDSFKLIYYVMIDNLPEEQQKDLASLKAKFDAGIQKKLNDAFLLFKKNITANCLFEQIIKDKTFSNSDLELLRLNSVQREKSACCFSGFKQMNDSQMFGRQFVEFLVSQFPCIISLENNSQQKLFIADQENKMALVIEVPIPSYCPSIDQ